MIDEKKFLDELEKQCDVNPIHIFYEELNQIVGDYFFDYGSPTPSIYFSTIGENNIEYIFFNKIENYINNQNLWKLPYLKGLFFLNCNSIEFPENASKMKKLEELYIKNLKAINSSMNFLTTIPKLRELIVHSLKFKSDLFKDEFINNLWSLPKLEVLMVENIDINYISNDIKNLKNLRTLVFNFTSIENLPNSIEQIPNLGYLNISFNKFKSFPIIIKKLSNLKNLTFAKNSVFIDDIDKETLDFLKEFEKNNILRIRGTLTLK